MVSKNIGMLGKPIEQKEHIINRHPDFSGKKKKKIKSAAQYNLILKQH